MRIVFRHFYLALLVSLLAACQNFERPFPEGNTESATQSLAPETTVASATDTINQYAAAKQDAIAPSIEAENDNLRRTIRRSSEGEIEFWNFNLPGEIEAHVLKLFALAAVITHHSAWEIELQPIPDTSVLRTVGVGTQIDISKAATLAGIDYEQLRALNPGYLQWATHPDQPQQMLLPFEHAELLESALIGLDKRDLLTWGRYEIQLDDALGAIARKLNIPVDILQTFNSLPGSRIVTGDSLLIPRTTDSKLLAAAPRVVRDQGRRHRIPTEYAVRNGDNLWTIARCFNLRSQEIATWNQIALTELLQLGQVLDLRYALTAVPLRSK